MIAAQRLACRTAAVRVPGLALQASRPFASSAPALKKVLVAVDNTEGAENAFNAAVELARPEDTMILFTCGPSVQKGVAWAPRTRGGPKRAGSPRRILGPQRPCSTTPGPTGWTRRSRTSSSSSWARRATPRPAESKKNTRRSARNPGCVTGPAPAPAAALTPDPRPCGPCPGPRSPTSGCAETRRRGRGAASWTPATSTRWTSRSLAPTAPTAQCAGTMPPLPHSARRRLTAPWARIGPGPRPLSAAQLPARQHRRLRRAQRELRRAAREAPAPRDDAGAG